MKRKGEDDRGNITEKREFERNKVNIPARYRSGSEDDHPGLVRDISFGGMFLESQFKHDAGDHIQADLNIEQYGKIAWAHGCVVRTNEKGIGIKFTHYDVNGVDDIIHFHRKNI
jgi:hypothetical protein